MQLPQTSQIPNYTEMDHPELDFCSISAVHPDILQTNILTRLDGPTLAAAGSAASQLRALSADDSLWRNICHRSWPSTAHPLMRHIIASFPSCHRSFYADSSSTLHRHRPSFRICRPVQWSPILISAVDIFYKNKHLLSKVQEMDTKLWTGSEFRIELFDPNESFPIPGKLDFRDLSCESELENNLTLSWILVDPTQTRSANLTSLIPIGVDRDWSTGDVEARFGTILSGEKKGELAECGVVVTCRGRDKEDLRVKQVRLEVKDIEGNKLGWRESLVILQEAMEHGERRRGGGEGGYNEFLEMKTERRERKRRRERRRVVVGIWAGFIAVVCVSLFVTVQIFQLFYSFFFSS